MRIAVTAVQGAFEEHEKMLEALGAEVTELRKAEDMSQTFDGIVLPGGESTVQGKLLKELGMFEALQQKINAGMPVLATCAGLILLAEKIIDSGTVHFGTLPAVVRRNAYGRQLGSFYAEEEFGDLGKVPMTFIRAPYIEEVKPGVEVLARVDGHIAGVRYKNQIAVSFHPELDRNPVIHTMFIEMCGEKYR